MSSAPLWSRLHPCLHQTSGRWSSCPGGGFRQGHTFLITLGERSGLLSHIHHECPVPGNSPDSSETWHFPSCAPTPGPARAGGWCGGRTRGPAASACPLPTLIGCEAAWGNPVLGGPGRWIQLAVSLLGPLLGGLEVPCQASSSRAADLGSHSCTFSGFPQPLGTVASLLRSQLPGEPAESTRQSSVASNNEHTLLP